MPQTTHPKVKSLGLPDNSKVILSTHPVLAHKLTKLRDAKTDANLFRHLLREITFYLGYEATSDLSTVPKQIKTPLGPHQGSELATTVALVPILRAGLGMVEAMLDLLPNARVHHIGMYRNSNSLLPVQYYNKLPKECHIDCAIVLEPVINTAGTIIATVAILKVWGVSQIKIISTIASKDGLKDLYSKHPEVEVIVAAIDDTLSESGVIVPGLGDAGDRQFDTDVHHIPGGAGSIKRKHSDE
ncbi:uracil phosphoribosyltransferase [Aphanomyces invadans]|uniref:uracil phosphoribosyltransferase n=1 Tax=Aphanomyces invadans TaxID=157072 RepID=A0A024UPY9_9STRA|nr:uracil phosphoribosyltransferase [Aphanomyces invadans]ETW07887.1 uracil phosphoribosyltransferase [Aphanomyces invadans]|eukprot:XP_008863980.1 uracil phosphoribosyltransferase [Aphanomyces invadans]